MTRGGVQIAARLLLCWFQSESLIFFGDGLTISGFICTLTSLKSNLIKVNHMVFISRNFFMSMAIGCAALASFAVPAAAQSYSQAEINNAPACGVLPAGANSYLCSCFAGQATGSVWGSGPYTGDSVICAAAVHSGVIGAGGGAVSVHVEAGRNSYTGSTRNGVATSDWGDFPNSISVFAARVASTNLAACGPLPDGPAPYSCSCVAPLVAGTVWGSGPFTADSNLCTAATHAGLVGANGGDITVTKVAGQSSYQGSTQNGITTNGWGQFGTSIVISSASTRGATAAPHCTTMPDGVNRHECSCAENAPIGTVWGSDPFTADSNICAAAIHAGAIGAARSVVVLRMLGLDGYRGSSNNGVVTQTWDSSFRDSITFDRN